MSKRILVVEDEELMRNIVKDFFEEEGYEVIEAADGQEALEKVDENELDLILLDIMIPKIDGFSVCRKIRKTKNIPIIMTTARSEDDDKLMGYEYGADDYITKPFSPKVLVAKANALLNRLHEPESEIIEMCGIEIDTNQHIIKINGEEIEFAQKEYDVLLYLMKNKEKAISRETLLTEVWGYDTFFGDIRTVDTHIKKIRAKLGDKAEHVKTLIKTGYKFTEHIEN